MKTALDLTTVADLKAQLKTHNDSMPMLIVTAQGQHMSFGALEVIGGVVRIDVRQKAPESVAEQMATVNIEFVEGAPV